MWRPSFNETGQARAAPRRSRSASEMVTATNTMSTVDTAARVGLTFSSASSHICFGKVVVRPPATKSAMVSSSNEVTNANRNAATRSAARGRRRSQGGARPRRGDGGELRSQTVRHPLRLADLASLAPGGGRAAPGRRVPLRLDGGVEGIHVHVRDDPHRASRGRQMAGVNWLAEDSLQSRSSVGYRSGTILSPKRNATTRTASFK